MRSIEISAKTVEDAIKLALEELQLSRDEVKIEVLEQPNKGFLGLLGNKNALVRVEEKYDPEKQAQIFLEKIFYFMHLKPIIEVKRTKEHTIFNLSGDNLGILIGRRGDTLDSLQFLLNLFINKKSDQKTKIIIDVEGYRDRRADTLINLATKLSEKVKRTGRKVVLEPMNPHERRIIHLALQDDDSITTYSEGEEPYRKVVIVPKNN
ncbi:MAG: spoIIIJ-associated protein [Clostridia bacterium]|jgi:spoIIIJ-associated protein|nr:spoIIIJ-associated protein [Clostridia bacterium]